MSKKLDDNLFEDVEYKEPSMDDSLFQEVEYSEEPVSKTESAIRGALQGPTLGFADEAQAALETIADDMKIAAGLKEMPEAEKAIGTDELGKPIFKDTPDSETRYEQRLKEIRDQYKAAQEANPNLYLGSEIVGGIVPALFSGGASAMGSIGKTLGKQALKEGAETATKEGAKKVSKEALKSLGKGTTTGAGYGAVSGAGYSEADTMSELLEDIKKGTATGAAAGVLLPVAGKSLKGAKKGVVDPALGQLKKGAKIIPAVKEGIEAYDLRKLGTGILGDKNYDKIIDRSKNIVKEKLQPFLVSEDEKFSRAIGKIYKRMDDLSGKKDLSKELNSIEKQVKNILESGKAPTDESRSALSDLVKTISRTKKDVITTFPKKNVDTGVEAALKSLKNKQNKLKSINKEVGEGINFTEPVIDLENGVIRSFETRTGKVITSPIKKGEFTPVGYKKTSDYGEFDVDRLKGLKDSAYEILEKAKKSDVGVAKKPIGKTYGLAKEGLQEIAEEADLGKALTQANKKVSNIRSLDDILPESLLKGDDKAVYKVAQFLRKADIEGISGDELRDKLGYFSKQLEKIDPKFARDFMKDSNQIAKAYELARTAKESFGLNLGTGKALGVWAGAGLGAVKKGTENLANYVSKVPQRTLNLASKKMANSNNEGLRSMGRQLDYALKQEGPVKDALIWSLSQNPAFRKELESYIPTSDEDFTDSIDQFMEQDDADSEGLDANSTLNEPQVYNDQIEDSKSAVDRVARQIGSGQQTPEYQLDQAIGAIENLPIDETQKEALQDEVINMETYQDAERLKALLDGLKNVT